MRADCKKTALFLFIYLKTIIVKLLDKRINLDLKFEKVIGLAIGYHSWGKTDIRTKQYQLLILCFVIELQTRTTIKEKIVKKDLYKKKKKRSITAKIVAFTCLLCFFGCILAIYEALNANTGSSAYSLTMVSAVFLVLFVVVGICYLAMDPKEKYYVE